jgi:uncharacterized protein YjbJ (UPF0337 family)
MLKYYASRCGNRRIPTACFLRIFGRTDEAREHIIKGKVGWSGQNDLDDGGIHMSGNTDKTAGTTNEAAGKIKQGIGKAVGSDKLQGEGAAQQAKGDAQKLKGNAKNAIKDGANKVADAANKNL